MRKIKEALMVATIVGTVMVLSMVLLYTLFAPEVRADTYAPDFVGRTVNKSIVVTPNRTYTVPSQQGSGTRVITIIKKDHHDKENHKEKEKDE